MAGSEGFEPPILGPEPSALPLGQLPLNFNEGFCPSVKTLPCHFQRPRNFIFEKPFAVQRIQEKVSLQKSAELFHTWPIPSN